MKRTVYCCYIFFCTLLLSTGVRAEGVHIPLPKFTLFYEPGDTSGSRGIVKGSHPAMLETHTTLVEEKQVVDFESRGITFMRTDKNFGFTIWQYQYDEMADYLQNREDAAFEDLWSVSSAALAQKSTSKKKSFNFLQMELPVQYPSWAARILGKDPPKLSITGFEEIIVAYEYNKTTNVGSDQVQKGTGGLNFDQNNQFSVTGSVGRLINVNIKASTKQGIDATDANDPFKNFHIDYKGEGNELEDEVIQEVSAGAMSFSMPGASLAGYSESKEGLVGIKVKSKIGPLELTTIASQEKGVSQKQTFNLTGSGSGTTPITEKDYIPNKIFFLDTAYLNNYLTPITKRTPLADIKKDSLQVWWASENEVTNKLSSADKTKYTFCRKSNVNGTVYRLLVPDREYVIDNKIKGCIRILDSITIQDQDELAIFMPADGSRISRKGSPFNILDTNKVKVVDSLWTLKETNPTPNVPTYNLMWRNVYSLPTSDFDESKFVLKVKRIPEAGGDSTELNGTTLLSSILGITDTKGVPLITYSDIFDRENKLLIIPPYDSAGTLHNTPFTNTGLGENNTNPKIYKYYKSDLEYAQITPKYAIIMSGSSKQSTFQLGSGNITENTEVVRGNDGDKLLRDVDYTMDYQFGTLSLISKKALAKTSIDVEYQSEALFIPDSKVFLGLHGEMVLPVGKNSFLGGSILYQSASSKEAIPKIGQEPYSKVLLDVNTKMNFEPEWMTDLVNKIPLVSTQDNSSLSFDIELAHSLSNPNTDNDAYIDDFESNVKQFSLGLDERSWYKAAPPAYLLTGDSLVRSPPAWISYWYQPKSDERSREDCKILKTSIFKKITNAAATSADKYEPVFNFTCQPAPNNQLSSDSVHTFIHPWAGIVYPIPSSSVNRTRDKYFEFWAKGDGGRLYIDMGNLNEDLCSSGGPPSGGLDNEDTASLGVYDSSEDKGLDLLPDAKEYYLIPNIQTHSWDTLHYDDLRLNDNHEPNRSKDPSRDNYKTYTYESSYRNNYPFCNGTEKSGDPLNTEDLNGDGLIRTDNYFRRYIDFDSVAQYRSATNTNDSLFKIRNYIVPDNISNAQADSGWHLYRIPINDSTIAGLETVGTPRWGQIKYIRLFWTNFENKKTRLNHIQFARMNLVRNEWQEVPQRVITGTDTAQIIKLDVSSINSEDNPDIYTPPPGISRTKDDQGYYVKESSLRLTFKNILPNDTAYARNILINQTINLSTYSTMTMQVHGDAHLNNPSDLYFFYRFGTNDSTYYEYRTPLRSDWDSRNNIKINLKELSALKLSEMTLRGDTVSSMNAFKDYGDHAISIRYRHGSPPNFANVTWMAMGVMRDGTLANDNPPAYAGEVWADELKVTGVHKFNGWASRISMTSNWGGFMNVSGNINYQDGDFQQMTESDMVLGNTTMSANVQANWTLGKLLPESWGINIPIGTSVSNSLSRPSLVSNTDIYLTNSEGSADNFMDLYQDVINMVVGSNVLSSSKTEAEHYQTATTARTFYTSFDKTTTSKNPFINMLIDRIGLDYKYSFNLTQAAKGRRRDDITRDYSDTSLSTSNGGSIKYNLTPSSRPDWTSWKPFAKLKSRWMPDRFKTYEFSLLPSTINFNLMDITYSKLIDIKEQASGSTNITKQNLTITHGATFAYSPINILNFNYSLNINRNFDDDVNSTAFNLLGTADKVKQIVNDKLVSMDPVWKNYGILYGERNRSQNTSLRFDPTLWDWLTSSADYSASYTQTTNNLANGDSTHYQNIGIASAFHLSSNLTLPTLFRKLSEGFSDCKSNECCI